MRGDQETEKRIRRDLDLEIERQKRQAAYMKELTEIRDEIDHQRRTIRYVIEEDEQKKTISQHRADLEVLQKTHGNILARKQHISQSVDASPPFEDVSTGQAELDDAWCVGTAKGDWERMKALEGAQSTPLDTLMSMIGLEDVKKEFLAIKTKVDTSLRQGVPLTSERFSCTLLGNPGTGMIICENRELPKLTSDSRQNHGGSLVRLISHKHWSDTRRKFPRNDWLLTR